ncbi:tyrosine--tRNA ligase [archaeon]|nr:tyrosine--tRNA ligase [archaeon]|tara:strand:+ start:537 stop:1532 length:996 start_codon:yes stop_codon:yes gene_type:complete
MKKVELIKRNTKEILSENELKEVLKKKKPVVYLGAAITGSPHVSYFSWILKMSDFLKAGFKVKILLADLHGALDNTGWDVLEKRYNYYSKIIPLMFKAIGVDSKGIEFVRGSSYQLKKEYMFDVLKMSTFASVRDCNKAASEVVKFGDNPKLSGLVYPIMQALDEEYLGVDVQLGGLDQRKIMVFARENLEKLGYKRRVEVMLPILPGLIGEKMSSSDEKSKIDLLDKEEEVKKKINGADCVSGDSNNGVMAFLKYVIMTIKEDRKEKFVIKRDEKYGGDLEYSKYDEIEKDFVSKKLHPLDLKNGVSDEINELLKVFKKKDLEKLKKLAY